MATRRLGAAPLRLHDDLGRVPDTLERFEGIDDVSQRGLQRWNNDERVRLRGGEFPDGIKWVSLSHETTSWPWIESTRMPFSGASKLSWIILAANCT